MSSIPIFIASDDNYAPFVATTIYSILSNTSSSIDFYILDGGILEKSKKLIDKSLEVFNNYSIEYIDMSSFSLGRFPNLLHYSVNTFSRYFIPEIKPKLDKVLYMDVDIIVRGDITELYYQDLEEYPIGAILEDFYEDNYKTLKTKIYPEYKDESKYFNAGVLLIKLEYFRKYNLTQKLVDMTLSLSDKLSCPDQDIYNIMFENNFKILDYIYNYMPDHYNYLIKLHPERADEIRKDAIVLHYTGGKPWHNKSCASKYFWDVAKHTKFYGIIVKPAILNIIKLNINKLLQFFLKIQFHKQKGNYIRVFGIYIYDTRKTKENKYGL